MDACRASSCCRGAKSAPWMEVPVVPSEKVTRVVPVPVLAAVVVAGAAVPQAAPGVPPRRWRSWISSPQRRPTRLSIPWTNEPLPHSTTNHSIFSTGFPRTGEFHIILCKTNRPFPILRDMHPQLSFQVWKTNKILFMV